MSSDLADAIALQEREEAARRRAHGLHDAELGKRRRLALELVEELKRPLIPGSPPTDLEVLANLAEPRPAR